VAEDLGAAEAPPPSLVCMGRRHIPKYRGQNRGYVALQAEADLKAAEARADESQRLADSLLAQHYEEWVPHWVADGYERVRLSRH
jgi:hypothetical protein